MQISEDFASGRTLNHPFGVVQANPYHYASTDGTHLKEKALHTAAHLAIDCCRASNGWIDCFKKRHNLVYKTMLGESATVNPETVIDWKNE